MKPELKPCPFCGGRAYLARTGAYKQSSIVECESCGCCLETGEEGDQCGTAWSRRAQAEPVNVPSNDIEESLKQLESLMHRVSKAAIVVGYGGERGELMLKYAEDMFKNTARKLLTQTQEQQLSSASTSDKPASGAQNEIHAPQNKWEAAIDHELVTMGCTADSFNSPKEALNALIAWHIAVATDPAVKGGYKLAPKTQQSPVHTRAPGAMSNEDLLALLKRFGFEFHYDKYVSGSGYGLLSKPYRLEDFRAILDAARGSNNTLET